MKTKKFDLARLEVSKGYALVKPSHFFKNFDVNDTDANFNPKVKLKAASDNEVIINEVPSLGLKPWMKVRINQGSIRVENILGREVKIIDVLSESFEIYPIPISNLFLNRNEIEEMVVLGLLNLNDLHKAHCAAGFLT
jgi:hypothetical protein